MTFRFFHGLLASMLALPLAAWAQQVGIGTASPDASAALELQSTTQGLLLPRMTAQQRAAIVNPATSLLVYQTDGTPGLYYYSGQAWINMATGRVPDAAGSALRPLEGVVSSLAVAAPYQGNFETATGLAADGNALYALYASKILLRIDPGTGANTLIAGNFVTGFADGVGGNARFNTARQMVMDASGNLYIADQNNHRIRKVTVASNTVTTVAGSGTAGAADGVGPAAQFNRPYGLALDARNNLYISDQGNHRIRKLDLTTGVVTTVAGSGTAGAADGVGPAAQFNTPYGLALNPLGEVLYIADFSNHRIRQIVLSTGAVSTLAGSTLGYNDGPAGVAQFHLPTTVAVDGNGLLYVADGQNHTLRRIEPASGVVTTVAGNGTTGSADGQGTAARFLAPLGLAFDPDGVLYVGQFGGALRVIR